MAAFMIASLQIFPTFQDTQDNIMRKLRLCFRILFGNSEAEFKVVSGELYNINDDCACAKCNALHKYKWQRGGFLSLVVVARL
jgi:hypothetical protein